MNDIRILIVDDNPAIHIDFRKILEPENKQISNLKDAEAAMMGTSVEKEEFTFSIDSAYQGEEALQFVSKSIEDNKQYAIAFIDVRMPPGMDGVEAANRILDLDPYIQIVICTAYSDYSWKEFSKRLGVTDRSLILKKPFENIEVLQIANTLTKKWQLNRLVQKHTHDLEELVGERTSKLEHSLSLMQATMEATSDGILVVDLDEKINTFNQKLLTILQLPQSLLMENDNQQLTDFLTKHSQNPQNFHSKIKEASEHHDLEFSDKIIFKDGRIIEYFSLPRYLDKEIIGRVFSFRDITEYKKMEEQLIHQATHDSLTNLPNRLVLCDRMEREIIDAKRNGNLLAILFIDLDHFKLINDTLGHDAGDVVLKIISSRLQQCIRNVDTVARIGGDEFIIVLPLTVKFDAVIPICQKLLAKVAEPFEIKNQTFSLTASIGISLYPKDGKEVNDLIANADTANHFAKESGRNIFIFFTMEENIMASKRLALESNLRTALVNQEFVLHYQPIIETATKKIISLEALLRWKHPKLGLIPPQEFIPVAEEAGLMLLIGDWVLATACAQSKAWRDQGVPTPPIAINLTAKQIARPEIVPRVAELLKINNLDSSAIELELTESALIERTDKITRIMQELQNIGVTLTIDDFGTGYSNLSYLNRLPIGKIKIDRSFVNYIGPNPNDVAVVQAIIAMTKSLNIRSLAEGVETKEQWEFLEKNHCDEIQGFYFYRSQSVDEMIEILRKQERVEM